MAETNLHNRFELVLQVIFFLLPSLFLSIKGSSSAMLFVLFFISLAYCLSQADFQAIKNSSIRLPSAILCLPFISELIIQLFREDFSWKALDGPSRFLISGVILMALHERLNIKTLYSFSAGCCVGVLLVFLSTWMAPHDWAGKITTYFVDPLTLGVYTVVMLSLGIVPLLKHSGRSSEIAALTIFIVGTFVIINTQSRTAYIALLAVSTYVFFSSVSQIRARVVCVIFLVCFTYLLKGDVILARFARTLFEVLAVVNGNPDTSLGVRVGLALLDVKIIFENWLFGLSDVNFSSYSHHATDSWLITERVLETKRLAGSHSEYLSILTRQGIVFGSISIFSLFIFPFIFLKNNFRGLGQTSRTMLFSALIAIWLGAIGIQILNLKMTSSFYGLYLCILFATGNSIGKNDRLQKINSGGGL